MQSLRREDAWGIRTVDAGEERCISKLWEAPSEAAILFSSPMRRIFQENKRDPVRC